MVIKCLDTYALVEISEANPHFSQYLKEDIVIPELIVAEFYSVTLRQFGKQTAQYWLRKIASYAKSVPLPLLIEAVEFRHEHKKNNISFFDAVGYIFSLRNNYLFVTGDKEFENFKGVEFRK